MPIAINMGVQRYGIPGKNHNRRIKRVSGIELEIQFECLAFVEGAGGTGDFDDPL